MKPNSAQLPLIPVCQRCRQNDAAWRMRYDIVGLCHNTFEWYLFCDDCRRDISRFFKVLEEQRL